MSIDEQELTIQQVEQARKEQDISEFHLSSVAGYKSDDGWRQAVERGGAEDTFLRRAAFAIQYHARHGILPLPAETKVAAQEGISIDLPSDEGVPT